MVQYWGFYDVDFANKRLGGSLRSKPFHPFRLRRLRLQRLGRQTRSYIWYHSPRPGHESASV